MKRAPASGVKAGLQQAVRSLGPPPSTAGNVAVVTMVRDEMDVLPAFLAHHLALVDSIHIADHRSIDGTKQYLEGLSRRFGDPRRLSLYRYDDPAYNQALVMTALLRHAFVAGADWVLAIDSDEFIAFDSRVALRAALESAETPLGRLDWINLLPRLPDGSVDSSAAFDPQGEFESIAGDLPVALGKLAVHRAFHERFPAAMFRTGQHKIHPYPGSVKLEGEPLGSLWHIPARSVAQVRSKRRNLIETSDFGMFFARSRATDYLEQQRQADRLLRPWVPAQDVRRLFEAVVLPYENPELRQTSREEWVRRPVTLPSTAIPGPELDLPVSVVPNGMDEPRTTRSSRRSANSSSVSIAAVLRTDGRILIRRDRLAVVREPLQRARVEVRLLGLRRHLAQTTRRSVGRRVVLWRARGR